MDRTHPITITAPFRFAWDGNHVIDIPAGPQMVSARCAEIARAESWGQDCTADELAALGLAPAPRAAPAPAAEPAAPSEVPAVPAVTGQDDGRGERDAQGESAVPVTPAGQDAVPPVVPAVPARRPKRSRGA